MLDFPPSRVRQPAHPIVHRLRPPASTRRCGRASAIGRVGRAIATPTLSAMLSALHGAPRDNRPDAVICTHATACELVAARLVRKADRVPVVNVTTDYGAPRLLAAQRSRRSSAWPTRPSAEEALRPWLPPDRPSGHRRPGTPPVQARLRSRSSRAKHFELPTDRRVILALAGSTMPGPYARFKERRSPSRCPRSRRCPRTIGRGRVRTDDAFADEIRSRAAGFGTTNVHVFGFVEQMAP